MEVRCQNCGHVHRIPRDIFEADEDKVILSCSGCGKSFQVLNPHVATLRVERTLRKVSSVTAKVNFEGRELSLPENQELSLQVLEGEEKGTVYPVTKPRITIGRVNADISLNDRLASRLHCALEVSAERVLIRDLESTNGTLVDDQPIETAELSGGSTFRIGEHLFQLVVTPKGA